MPVVPLAALRAKIAAGTPASLCVLVGHDEVEKATVADEFIAIVDEGLQAFNVDRLSGGDTSVATLLEAATMLPMMAPRRIVLVRHAEQLLVPKGASGAADDDQARLEAFIADPPPQTTVVFVCGALDERRRVVKQLREQADVTDCGTISDPAGAEQWVKAAVEREGVTMESGAVRALAQRAGLDVTRLRSGLARVLLYTLGQKSVSVADVHAVMPVAADAQENFGIANAIGRGDAAHALRQLGVALDAGTSEFMVLGQLRVVAERFPSARIAAAMDALLRTDLAMKSSGGDSRVLVERLIVELCAAGGGGVRGRFGQGRASR